MTGKKITFKVLMSPDGRFAWRGFEDPPCLDEAPFLVREEDVEEFREGLIEDCEEFEVDLWPLELKTVELTVID